jgi:hypothetical protein
VIPVAQAAIIHAQQAQQYQQQQQADAMIYQQQFSAQNNGQNSQNSQNSPNSPNSQNSQSNNGGGQFSGNQGQNFDSNPVQGSSGSPPLALDDGEEQKFDVNDWSQAVALQAFYRAKLTLTRTVNDPISEEELEAKIIGQRANHPNIKKIKQNLRALAEGCKFIKFKRSNSAKRLIWCTPLFDYVLWGSEDKQDVKGFIPTANIQEINQGFGKNKCRLYVVSPGRTLELDARDANNAKDWHSYKHTILYYNSSALAPFVLTATVPC